MKYNQGDAKCKQNLRAAKERKLDTSVSHTKKTTQQRQHVDATFEVNTQQEAKATCRCNVWSPQTICKQCTQQVGIGSTIMMHDRQSWPCIMIMHHDARSWCTIMNKMMRNHDARVMITHHPQRKTTKRHGRGGRLVHHARVRGRGHIKVQMNWAAGKATYGIGRPPHPSKLGGHRTKPKCN